MNFCPIWLANEVVLSFLVLKKCAKAQFNPIILSKVIAEIDDGDNRQTDTVVKTVFSHSGGLKRSDLMKTGGGGQILHKSYTFFENVII